MDGRKGSSSEVVPRAHMVTAKCHVPKKMLPIASRIGAL